MLARILVPLCGLICLLPAVTSPMALTCGIAIALIVGNPYIARTRVFAQRLLMWSVIGLGAGMDLRVVASVGASGFGYTVVGISATLALGILLGRMLKNERDLSILITAGTAICGGSAIAAVASTLKAKHHHVSVALGTVFLLNALALMIFPVVGHALGLSENQFGLWSALAIHDTSSVVGATMQYGPHALEVGTTVKLARALWIVPLTLVIGLIVPVAADQNQTGQSAKAKRPWFILGFLIAAAIVTWFPEAKPLGHWIEIFAKRTLVLTLFLIGVGLTRQTLKSVGMRALLQGVILWAVVASMTLAAVVQWAH